MALKIFFDKIDVFILTRSPFPLPKLMSINYLAMPLLVLACLDLSIVLTKSLRHSSNTTQSSKASHDLEFQMQAPTRTVSSVRHFQRQGKTRTKVSQGDVDEGKGQGKNATIKAMAAGANHSFRINDEVINREENRDGNTTREEFKEFKETWRDEDFQRYAEGDGTTDEARYLAAQRSEPFPSGNAVWNAFPCPPCLCATDGKKRKIANCSKSRLTTIPSTLPRGISILDMSSNLVAIYNLSSVTLYPNLSSLILSKNKIRHLFLDRSETFSSNIVYLNLENNLLHDAGNASLRNLPKLKWVSFKNNYLSYITPFLFDGCVSLKYVDLTHNHLQRINEKAFDSLNNLTELILTGNVLLGYHHLTPRIFQGTHKLQKLHIDCTFNGAMSYPNDALGSLSNLLELFVDGIGKGVEFGPQLKGLTRLETLVVGGRCRCRLNNVSATFFDNVPGVKSVAFKNCDFTSIDRNAFKTLTQLSSYAIIWANRYSLDQAFQDVAILPNARLKSLTLSGFHHSDINCKKLNKVHAKYLTHLSIEELDLSFNNLVLIQDDFLHLLPQTLKRFILNHNKLSMLNDMWRHLSLVKQLAVFDVSYQNIDYQRHMVVRDHGQTRHCDLIQSAAEKNFEDGSPDPTRTMKLVDHDKATTELLRQQSSSHSQEIMKVVSNSQVKKILSNKPSGKRNPSGQLVDDNHTSSNRWTSEGNLLDYVLVKEKVQKRNFPKYSFTKAINQSMSLKLRNLTNPPVVDNNSSVISTVKTSPDHYFKAGNLDHENWHAPDNAEYSSSNFVNAGTSTDDTQDDAPTDSPPRPHNEPLGKPVLNLPPNLTTVNSTQYMFFGRKLLFARVVAPSLSQLYFSYSFITDWGNGWLPSTVEIADLSDNYCNVLRPKFFHVNNSLKYLYVRNNYLGPSLTLDTRGDIFAYANQLVYLNLAFNEIFDLPNQFLRGMKSIQRLILSENKLQILDLDFSYTPQLKFLELDKNSIIWISERSRKTLDVVASKHTVFIDLSLNPLPCTCGGVELLQWLISTKAIILNEKLLQCTDRNRAKEAIGDVQSKINELQRKCASPTLLRIISSSIGSYIVVFIISAILYKNRWKLVYARNAWLAKLYGFKPKGKTISGSLYDAFVVYCEEDRDFVLQDLLEELEDKRNHRICVEDRDFLPGSLTFNNITCAIQNSTVTVLVLSPEFLMDRELEYARQMALIEEYNNQSQREVVLLLNYKQANDKALPKDLLMLMKKGRFLDFPRTCTSDGEEVVDQPTLQTFWDRFSTEIGHAFDRERRPNTP